MGQICEDEAAVAAETETAQRGKSDESVSTRK